MEQQQAKAAKRKRGATTGIKPSPGSDDPRANLTREEWALARKDFIEGDGNIRFVALKHNVTYRAVCECAVEEDWPRQRREFKERDTRLPNELPYKGIIENPPQPSGVIPIPEPLSADFFIHWTSEYFSQIPVLMRQVARMDLMLELYSQPDDIVKLVSSKDRLLSQLHKLFGFDKGGKSGERNMRDKHGRKVTEERSMRILPAEPDETQP
jgi:hypothetical protein